jgi:hypothetical protein
MWLAILFTIVRLLAQPGGVPLPGCDSTGRDVVEGRLVVLASSTRQEAGRPADVPAISATLATADGLVHVMLAADTAVLDGEGRSITPTALPSGGRLRAVGQHTAPTIFEASCLAVQP